MYPLGHGEIPVTGGPDLDDRGYRHRRAAMRRHHLILAEILGITAEPDDRLPAVQDERVRLRPLAGT